VDPEDIGRGGFDVLAVHHPDDEVINSVIVARKVADDGHGSKCCRTEASAAARPATGEGKRARTLLVSRRDRWYSYVAKYVRVFVDLCRCLLGTVS